MEYKLIAGVNKGFILSRKPKVIRDMLTISFLGNTSGATAIFENENNISLYRELNNESCIIPADFLDGNIKVAVVTLDGKEDSPKYKCESIFTKRVSDGVLICPNGIDIPMQIIEIFNEIGKIKKEMVTEAGKHDDLDKKVEKLLDGYDFD